MAGVKFLAGQQAGAVKGQLGQFGHGAGDVGQRGLGLAVQSHQAFHDQLAQHAQGGRGVVAARVQGVERGFHGGAHGCARGEQVQVGAIAAVQALEKARMGSQAGAVGGAVSQFSLHGLRGAAGPHVNRHRVALNPRHGRGS